MAVACRRGLPSVISVMLWLGGILTCDGQKPINLGGVKRRDVYIAGFFPYGSHVPESHVGRGVMPSVKLAVDHINEDPMVLRNYRLHMWWNDTEDNIMAMQTITVAMGDKYTEKHDTLRRPIRAI
ncbi:hypothetical protein KM043_018726 [Ampulex compressa]|nr:hypothetical protein KM043_018726 [Ampulex compressa]